MKQTDKFYMKHAYLEAKASYEKEEIPVGAIIEMGGKIISRGHNMTNQLTDATAHAEMIALTSAFHYLGSIYLQDASIYITVEPCLMCAGALYWSKIGKIVYGASDVQSGYQQHISTAQMFNKKTKVVHGVMKKECELLMKSFFENLRKKQKR